MIFPSNYATEKMESAPVTPEKAMSETQAA